MWVLITDTCFRMGCRTPGLLRKSASTLSISNGSDMEEKIEVDMGVSSGQGQYIHYNYVYGSYGIDELDVMMMVI